MTMRSIDSRLWSDGWVRKLNALDRYLFLYLLTNDHSAWCGVYELDIEMMAFESGIDRIDLERAMLPRLAPKVIYTEGWVYIPNWMKYHLSSSGTISPQHQKGFDTAWKQVPERIRLRIKEIEDTGYPVVGVSPSASSIASTFPIVRAAPEVVHEVLEENPKKPQKYPNARKVFDLWGKYPKNWILNKTQLQAAENLFEERGITDIQEALKWYDGHKDDEFCPQVSTPYDLDSKWSKLEIFVNKL